jgi:hypothetical protein
MKFSISASSRSREKFQNQMKLQKIATAIINAITRGSYTTLILMPAYLQRFGVKILGDDRSKDILGPLIRDAPNTTKGAELQTMAEDTTEARTH